jgi:hypothetical protein
MTYHIEYRDHDTGGQWIRLDVVDMHDDDMSTFESKPAAQECIEEHCQCGPEWTWPEFRIVQD